MRRSLSRLRRVRSNYAEKKVKRKITVYVRPKHSKAGKRGWKTRLGLLPKAERKKRSKKARKSARPATAKRRVSKTRSKAKTTKRSARKAAAPKRTSRKIVTPNRSRRRRAAPRRNKRARRAAPRRNRSIRRSRSVRRAAPRRNKRTRRAAPRRNRRAMRRNPLRRIFRRNGIAGLATEWLKTGALVGMGLIGHKLLTGLVKNLLNSKGSVVSAAESPAADAKAAAGLGLLPASLSKYSGTISGGVTAALGVYLTLKYVKNADQRKLIAGGMVASFVHTLVIDVLKANASTAKYAGQISGLGSDSTAARLSAMYGVGSNIMPMYSPIGEYFGSGVGEYFGSGVSGLGAAPYEAQAGMGEYFGSGVGAYEANPDMYQAAAGFGALESSNSNHINPMSNLDRELSIAEAAAGVGAMGPFQAAAGLGNTVSSVATSQTWIPGESNPAIWAGVRPIDQSQMATAQIPAGILSAGGGQGVFG
jgi:hypothetical protein